MILNFLSGKVADSNNRFIYDIWKMYDSEIEDTHNFIQWIFPLNEESQAVPNSPILTENEILQISNSNIAKINIEKSSKWYLNFLDKNRHWITHSDHNHLRITRAIKSLRLIHSDEEADKFKRNIFNFIEGNEHKINTRTLNFWEDS